MAAPVGVTSSFSTPAEYIGAPRSSSTVAGDGTGNRPCAHSTVPPPTLSGEADPLVDAQCQAADGRANDVHNRIHRADFVEVNLFHVGVVDLRLGLTQRLEDVGGGLAGGARSGLRQ